MTSILVLQLKRTSDLLLTVPALSALRRHDPEARITLAIDSNCRELIPAIGGVDDSFVFSRKAGNRSFWQKLILSSFDVCLDYTGNDRSAICSILSKSSRRIAFRAGMKSNLRAAFYTEFVESSPRDAHVADHYLRLVRPLGIETDDARIRLNLPDWALKKADQLLDETVATDPYLVIHPGTTRPEKYWAPQRWAEVIDFCRKELGWPCIVTGAKETFEAEQIAAIKEKTSFHDLTGRTDLLTLAALIQRARLLLSVDSVAMHLGAAFETPQAALFGRSSAFHWRPRHPKAVALQAGNPSGELTPQHRSASMDEISVQQVTDTIRLLTS